MTGVDRYNGPRMFGNIRQSIFLSCQIQFNENQMVNIKCVGRQTINHTEHCIYPKKKNPPSSCSPSSSSNLSGHRRNDRGGGLRQISATWMNTFLSSTMQQRQGRKRMTTTAMLGYHSTTKLHGVIPSHPTAPDLRSSFPHLDDCFHFQTSFDIVYFLRIYFAIKFHNFAFNQI